MRFEVGTTLQEWELKKKRISRNVKGCEAILRKAAVAYQKAEAENSWPVDFAYRDYTKEEMQIKLSDYRSNLRKAEEEDRKISQGLFLLRDTSKRQDREILQLEKEIQIYSDNLELIRSGKINSEIADFMKKLDKTVADQREIHKENLETAERESEVSAAGKNREKKLVKAYEKFNSAAVPERKECNVGKIVKELRKERVPVENMKAEEWHSLMKGKAVQPPLVSGTSGAAGKGSALMLARTPAGYALKAAGAINQASRQANAEM